MVSVQIPDFLRRLDGWLLAAICAGIILFFLRFGPAVLDPRSLDWLLAREDAGSYYLIWDYFRHETWSFPLGAVSGYLYPMGTSLPLVDGLPLLAIPLKAVSRLLPADFQYYGFWLALCYTLQACFGYLIARRFTGRGLLALVGALLFLTIPVFLFRQGHIALSSHWTLLAALYLYLKSGDSPAGIRPVSWALLLAAVALIHPYLTAMVLIFFWAACLRPGAGSPRLRRLVVACGGSAMVILLWWIAGYFVGRESGLAQAWGFGEFSTNLNSLYNPMSNANFLKTLPARANQYEGYGYLGAGWLFLCITAAVTFIPGRFYTKRLRRHVILAVALAGCYLFALSNVVAWGSKILLHVHLPGFTEPLTSTFRASGRFIWPVIYAGSAFLMAALARSKPARQLIPLLGLALVLQVADLTPMEFTKDYFGSLRFNSRLASPEWKTLAQASNCIATIPPFQFTTENHSDFRDICYLATTHRLPTTAGYAGRIPERRAQAMTDSILAAIRSGSADRRNLYIIEKSQFPSIYKELHGSFHGSRLDGYHVCYSHELPSLPPPLYAGIEPIGLPEFLSANKNRTLLMAARDDMSLNLSPSDKDALAELGIAVDSIGYRHSFAALSHDGRCLWQAASGEAEIRKEIAAGTDIEGFMVQQKIILVSGGYLAGNRAALRIEGRNECFNLRGLNILVLDEQQRPLEMGVFDTFEGGPGLRLSYKRSP